MTTFSDCILTDYYCFEKKSIKSKHRFDCVSSTESYPVFECHRATRARRETDRFDATSIGDLVIYLGDVPERFGGAVKRKADKSITIKSNNLSSVYKPDPKSEFAYGDVKGTTDALLFKFNGVDFINGSAQQGGIIEVFVARGKSRDRMALYNLLEDGALDDEMQLLREKATRPSDSQ